MPPRLQTYDSNGPDVRVRGNAHQVYERYLALARDAYSSGDRIAAEGFYQFAEHYYRIVNDSTDPHQEREHDRSRDFHGRPRRPDQRPDYPPYGYGGESMEPRPPEEMRQGRPNGQERGEREASPAGDAGAGSPAPRDGDGAPERSDAKPAAEDSAGARSDVPEGQNQPETADPPKAQEASGGQRRRPGRPRREASRSEPQEPAPPKSDSPDDATGGDPVSA